MYILEDLMVINSIDLQVLHLLSSSNNLYLHEA